MIFDSLTTGNHDDRPIMLIKTSVADVDSTMPLYKIYNLPIFNPHIRNPLQYNMEGNYLAINKEGVV